MKRLTKAAAALALVLVLLASTMVVATAAPAKLTLNAQRATIWVEDVTCTQVDEVFDLRATWNTPEQVRWLSLNKNVVTVESIAGKPNTYARLRAKGIGTTIIFAYVPQSGAYASCTVTVAPKANVTSICFLNETTIQKITKTNVAVSDANPFPTAVVLLDVGGMGRKMKDQNALSKYFMVHSSNPTVVDDSAIALSDGDGRTLYIPVRQIGTAVITITARDNPKCSAKLTVVATNEVTVTGITLTNVDNSKITTALTYGQNSNQYKIKATLTTKTGTAPSNDRISWYSSNPDVIETVHVSDQRAGELSFVVKSAGKATLTAAALDGSKKTAKVTYTVTMPQENRADGITVTDHNQVEVKNGDRISMQVGSSFAENRNTHALTFTATATKNQATAPLNDVTWKSSAPKVAQVYKNGTTVRVEPVKPGKATITATTADGSKKSLSFVVEVAPVATTKIEVDKATTNLYINDQGVAQMQRGTIAELQTLFTPIDAYNQALTYKTSNKKLATVSKTGTITALGEGTVDVTVTNSKTAQSYVLPIHIMAGYPAVPQTTVTIGGNPYVSNTLTANVTVGTGADIMQETNHLTYAWQHVDAAPGTAPLGTGSTYLLQATDAGKTIKVDVLYYGYVHCTATTAKAIAHKATIVEAEYCARRQVQITLDRQAIVTANDVIVTVDDEPITPISVTQTGENPTIYTLTFEDEIDVGSITKIIAVEGGSLVGEQSTDAMPPKPIIYDVELVNPPTDNRYSEGNPIRINFFAVAPQGFTYSICNVEQDGTKGFNILDNIPQWDGIAQYYALEGTIGSKQVQWARQNDGAVIPYSIIANGAFGETFEINQNSDGAPQFTIGY